MAQIALALTNKNDTPKVVVLVDASGNDLSSSIGGSNASVAPTGAAVPASATYIGFLAQAGTNLVGLQLGQQVANNSLPIVLTAAQITTLTPPAAITGFALETGGHLATIDTSTAASKTDLDSIVTNTNKLIAPSVNAGNRDATTQRIIESGNPTSTVTQVASSASDVSLLAANANKKGTLFFNDSTQTLYLLYGTGAASTTNYSVQVPSKAYFEDPLHYTGGFHGIWAAANGFVYCTEVS